MDSEIVGLPITTSPNSTSLDKPQESADFVCCTCGLKLKENTDFTKHLSSHIKEKLEELLHLSKNKNAEDENSSAKSEVTFECAVCRTTFQRKEILKSHLARVCCRGLFEHCVFCPAFFSEKKDLEKHYRQRHCMAKSSSSVSKQRTKSQLFAKPSQRPELLSDSSPAVQKDERRKLRRKSNLQFHCCFCRESFRTSQEVKQHTLTHKAKVLTCDLCARTFKYRRSLVSHKKRHAQPRRFECTLCDATLKTKQNLQSHFLSIHSDERPFNCDKCSSSFKFQRALKGHQMRLHAELKPFKCRKSFKTSAETKTHMVAHPNVRGFKCDLCPRVYKLRSSLLRHKKGHNLQRPNRKVFKCTLCCITFERQDSLTAHILAVHSDDKMRQFKCNLCGLSFKRITTLQNHQFRLHSDLKPFKCPKCTKSFKSETEAKAHVAVHSKIKAYRCEMCLRSFKLHGSLYRHIKKFHLKQQVNPF